MKNSSSSGGQEVPILPTYNAPCKDTGDKEDATRAGKSLLSPEHAASPVVAGAAYCCVSAAMVLLNKFALSGFDFTCPNTLLLLQCITAVVFVKLAESLGFWKLERLRWDIVQVTSPLTMICMLHKGPHTLHKCRKICFTASGVAVSVLGRHLSAIHARVRVPYFSACCCRYGSPSTFSL